MNSFDFLLEEFLNERIDSIIEQLKNSDEKFKKENEFIEDFQNDMLEHYSNRHKDLPDAYEEKLRDYFLSVDSVQNSKVTAIYKSVVVDCISMLTKMGYMK